MDEIAKELWRNVWRDSEIISRGFTEEIERKSRKIFERISERISRGTPKEVL